MKLRFWGVRGSIPTPGPSTVKYGGNTSCSEVITQQGETLILDAGTGLFQLGRHLAKEKLVNYQANLLISHTHWDHIQGFPFFDPIFFETTSITIFGPKNKDSSLRSIFARQMANSYFPVHITQLPSKLEFIGLREESFQLNSLTISTKKLRHPGGVLSYKIVEGNSTLIYATDNELPWEGDISQGLVLDPYITSVIDYIQGADLLIYDCQYRDEEYPHKRDWGHSSVSAILQVARDAHVKRLVFFHHDPHRTDEGIEQILRETSEKDLGVEIIAAREQMVLDV